MHSSPDSGSQPSASALRKTLHLINGEHYSGAERVQDLLAARLPEFGYQVTFATVKDGLFATERKSDNAEIFRATMSSQLDFRQVTRLAALVRDRQIQIVHTHTVRTVMLGRMVCYLTGVPLVHHIHSPADKDSDRKWMNQINYWTERASLVGASRIVCVSDSLRQHMENCGYAPDRLSVVANGVPALDQLNERPTPSGTWTIGTIALFRPRKGTEVLLEAVARLRQQGHDVRVRAVGPFETEAYGNKLTGLVEQLGLTSAVEWTGFTDDVDAELRQMDVMVLPSLFGEGLPMVVAEAMAAGVPVVGTKVQGIPEILTPGAGLLAEPGSAPELADAIASLLTGKTDWQQLRHNAWQRQRESYSDRSMAERLAEVYDNVLGRPRVGPARVPSELAQPSREPATV